MTESDVEPIIEEDEADLKNSDAVFDELEESLEIEEVQNSQDKSILVSQREIISIIFSKKTLYHVLVLFILLSFFGIISYTKSDLASSLILIFGYGCCLGYFLTAALNRFDDVIGEHRTFFSLAGKIAAGLFDPIALSTQHIEFALVMHKNGDAEGELSELKAAEDLARTALGRGHPFVVAVERKLATLGETTSTKRQKVR